MTRTYVEQARAEIYTGDGPKAALHVIAAPNFNHGVVGLVASRLTEELYRPVLVAHQDEVYTKGSGRSIPEFNITDALDQCADLLVKYGGHAAAAGFTVENHNLAALRERLQAIAQAELAGQSLQRSLCIDAAINLRPVTPTLVEQIASLEPFGYGNPQPIFMTNELVVQQCRPVGRDNAHLKLKLFDGKQVWDAIGFRMGEWAEQLGPGVLVDAAYHLEFNAWQGRRSMQLNLQDLRFSEEV
jgi:single-stranded-DNA-specific exonuclease